VLVNSKLGALLVVIRLLLFVTLFIALNPRSQSALLGDRVSTTSCHKQLVEFIRNAFSNTCLVFNKTKMDFLVIEMKGLT